MKPWQRVRYGDYVCPVCHHIMKVVGRHKRIRRGSIGSDWMLERKCPECGTRTMKKDTDQSDGGQQS
jgi:uncharacterized Zn finger protein (UPF0148 family)